MGFNLNPDLKLLVDNKILVAIPNEEFELNYLFNYVKQNPMKFTDRAGLSPTSCGQGMVYCNNPGIQDMITSESLKHLFRNAELIAKGNKIRKVKKLCDKFGGKAKDWKKKKGIDKEGREWHWYENKGNKYGLKEEGWPDPF